MCKKNMTMTKTYVYFQGNRSSVELQWAWMGRVDKDSKEEGPGLV